MSAANRPDDDSIDFDPASSGPITKPMTQRGGSSASWPEYTEVDPDSDYMEVDSLDVSLGSVTPTTPGMPLRLETHAHEEASPHTIRSGSWTAPPIAPAPVLVIPAAPPAPPTPPPATAPATPFVAKSEQQGLVAASSDKNENEKNEKKTLLEPAIARRKVAQSTVMEPAIAKKRPSPPPLPELAETFDDGRPRRNVAPTVIDRPLTPSASAPAPTVDDHTVILPPAPGRGASPSSTPPSPSSRERQIAHAERLAGLHWEDVAHARLSSSPPPNVTVLLRRSDIQAASPSSPPVLPGANANAFDVELVENVSQPTRYRDAIQLGDGHAMLVMTDFGAAPVSSELVDRLRRVVRNAAGRGDSPGEILRILNREVEEVGLTATALCVKIDLVDQVAVVASAGANAPFVLRGSDTERMVRAAGDATVGLGLVHSAQFTERSVHFEAGDMLLVASHASCVALERLFSQPALLTSLKSMRSVDWQRPCVPPGSSLLSLVLRASR